MPYTITDAEYVEISGVPLATPAWTLINLYELWSGPATRGTDVVIPEAEGVRPNRRRITATRHQLQLEIYGDFTWAGAVNTNARLGLWNNIAHLRTNVTDPPGAGAGGTRPVILHIPGPATRSGNAHVESLVLGGESGPNATRAIIDITIVEGRLT